MFFDRPDAGRTAVVLHVHFRQATASSSLAATDALDECIELAATADIAVVETITASRDMPHPRWFIGSGKLEEIRATLGQGDADLLLVNHELSAGQQRNLEEGLQCRVMTRTELILHIFADRARTYEGQLQVELAQLKHAQTRLIRGWTHLDRQKGGIGLRGAGEKQLELDQRMLSDRLRTVEKKLSEVARRRQLGRRRRQRSHTKTVALVGYTNAGKSTLFNALTTAQVLVEDKLFATLDPTMRRLSIPGIGHVVLADTVGFISHLPHSLIEAFKATLEEVANADLLLHVVDVSGSDEERRVAQVNTVLQEIGAREIPTVMVCNKIDALRGESSHQLYAHGDCGSVEVSALTGQGMEEVIDVIARCLGVGVPTEILLEVEDGKTRAWLYQLGAVIDEKLSEDGRVALTLQADPQLLATLRTKSSVLLQTGDALPKLSAPAV